MVVVVSNTTIHKIVVGYIVYLYNGKVSILIKQYRLVPSCKIYIYIYIYIYRLVPCKSHVIIS